MEKDKKCCPTLWGTLSITLFLSLQETTSKTKDNLENNRSDESRSRDEWDAKRCSAEHSCTTKGYVKNNRRKESHSCDESDATHCSAGHSCTAKGYVENNRRKGSHSCDE